MGWVVNATPWPLYPWKDPVPIVEEAEWAPVLVWMGAENLAPTGIRSMDHPVHSKLFCSIQKGTCQKLEERSSE
jgi:hypothetical protein